MAYKDPSLSRLGGSLDSYFLLESKYASTRTGDAYKALDKYKRQGVGVWVTREPMNAEQLSQFAGRIQTLRSLGITNSILSLGVDAEDYAFAVCPLFDGLKITVGSSIDAIELERRYLACIRIIEKLHQSGLTCGDLCLDSFMTDRDGKIRLIGILGGFDFPAPHGEARSALLSYVAPEHRTDGGASTQGDVFALGVLGYLIFTGKLPEGREYTSVRTFNKNAPAWSDGVLPSAMSSNASARPRNATELLQSIVSFKEREISKGSVPAVVGSEKIARVPQRSNGAVQIRTGKSAGKESHKVHVEQPTQQRTSVRIGRTGYMAGIGIIAIIFAIGIRLIIRPVKSNVSEFSISPGDVAIPAGRMEGGASQYIKELAASDDPIAHDSLVRAYKEATTDELRESIRNGIFERTNRLGLNRSAEQVRIWMTNGGTAAEPAIIESLLRLIDPGLPLAARREMLVRTFPSATAIIPKITAALALDQGRPEDYREQFISMAKALGFDDPSGHSALAIILLIPDVSSIFLDDVMASAGTIPESDVLWLLQEAVQRGGAQLQMAADLAATRKLVSPAREPFLDIVRRRSNLPLPIARALIESAAKGVGKDEISTFGTWYDRDAEKVLIASLVDASDIDVAVAAFDALGGKVVSDPYLSSLIDFIRTTYGEEREHLVRLVGVIGLEDSVSDETFKSAFDGIEKLPKIRELVHMLLKAPSPRVLREVMERCASFLDVSALLDLLSHREPAVRIAAIKNLSGANDIAALKLLIDGYERERNPDVRAAYERYIGVVKERRASRG